MFSWKTTLLGIASGALNLFANGASWKQVLLSAGLAAFGLVAKDSQVTGGSVKQPTV